MIKFRWRNGRLYFRWFGWRGWCWIGLHFLCEDFRKDGYCCPCGKNYLWNESIR
jgi:hypothetical protein